MQALFSPMSKAKFYRSVYRYLFDRTISNCGAPKMQSYQFFLKLWSQKSQDLTCKNKVVFGLLPPNICLKLSKKNKKQMNSTHTCV